MNSTENAIQDLCGKAEAETGSGEKGLPHEERRASVEIKLDHRLLALRDRYRSEWRAQGLHSGLSLREEIHRCVTAQPGTRLTVASRERPCETTTPELHREALQCARGLLASGFNPGEAIVLQSPHLKEGLALFLGAIYAGLIVVPVIHFYGPAELNFILRQTKARALAVPGTWANIDFQARVAQLDETPDLAHVIVLCGGTVSSRDLPWSEIMSRGEAAAIKLPALDPDAVCLINFTSGSTSDPKGVLHSHHTIAGEVKRCHLVGKTDAADDLMLFFYPAGHIGGVIAWLRPFLVGENVVYLDRFDADHALEVMAKSRITRAGGVPFHGVFVLDRCDPAITGRLKYFNLGGASVPPSLVERFGQLGIKAARSYGSTEHPTISGGDYEIPLEKRAYTDGTLLPGNVIRIVDDRGQALPAGHPGEIVSMGPELCLGYLDPALNEAAFTQDGWFRTGDVGVLDAAGCLTIVDRIKDIIIRGGENISSKEVEDLLVQHSAVAEVAVVGYPDPLYGERVAAVVRTRQGCTLDLDQIRVHFSAHGVARQKTPEYLIIMEDLPRTPTGKLQKVVLRRQVRSMIENDSRE